MKITQTDTQLEIKSNGVGQMIIGLIMVIGGIATAIFLPGATDDRGQQMPGWIALIGAAVAVAGIAFIFFAKTRKVTIQRSGNTTITAKRVIGGGSQAQTIPTATIVAVRLSTYIESTSDPDGGISGGNPTSSRRSLLSLVLNNNDLVELGNSGGNGSFSINGLNVSGLISKAPLSKEANQIATFLGVPLQADDTSSIAGAVRSVKAAFSQPGSQPPAQTTSFHAAPQQSSPTPPSSVTSPPALVQQAQPLSPPTAPSTPALSPPPQPSPPTQPPLPPQQ